ncbi:ORF MSV038 hypothetical protein [Melanoplus sanguinipes entomopoxvirus]|uniref:Uncharacterized protein n=1 Tax=Melanoplus sanguinipes entomopoxvirus TaxID=83191 RepID=Q9YW54_MSEPV|nr:ORF MSV038 hypothetical protein [Melanoplus sanguinipes entomopoxvirus]AAC97616.1 ORF MSV038 hypothetical protein [Melanoplus sanguinipes entomopoxvirus 'O']
MHYLFTFGSYYDCKNEFMSFIGFIPNMKPVFIFEKQTFIQDLEECYPCVTIGIITIVPDIEYEKLKYNNPNGFYYIDVIDVNNNIYTCKYLKNINIKNIKFIFNELIIKNYMYKYYYESLKR